MELADDGAAFGDLDEDEAAALWRMDKAKTKAKGGAVFVASRVAGGLSGLDFGAESCRAVSERVAKEHEEKVQKEEADAKFRAAVADTAAGRAAAAQAAVRGVGRPRQGQQRLQGRASVLEESSGRRRRAERAGSEVTRCGSGAGTGAAREAAGRQYRC